MTDIFFAPRKVQKGRQKLIIATFIVLAVFGVDALFGGVLRIQVRSLVARISGGAGAAVRSVAESGFFSTKRGLERRILALQEELNQLKEEQALFANLSQENDELRSLLSVAQKDLGITAPILSSFRSSPYGTFLIGAGSRDGVVVDTLVLSRGGFVIGRVSEVGTHSSLTTQLFAPGQSIDALIAGSGVSLEGRGGGNAYARMPHGLEVHEGDSVLAPTLGGKPIGIVREVRDDPSSAFSDVYIGLPINLSGMQFVYVQK